MIVNRILCARLWIRILIFSCSSRYLTRSLRLLAKFRLAHSKSTRWRVISSIYYNSSSKDTNNHQRFNCFFFLTYPRVSFNDRLFKLGYFSFPVTYKSDSHMIVRIRILTANKLEKFIYA